MKEKTVEVVLALPGRQEVRRVALPEDATVADALGASGLGRDFPQLDVSRLGIHGKRITPASVVRDGDRVEIYRSLKRDPMQNRINRAKARRAAE